MKDGWWYSGDAGMIDEQGHLVYMDRVKELLSSMERLINSGQEHARGYMDREPSQKMQNNYWRYVLQDIRELKSIILGEER